MELILIVVGVLLLDVLAMRFGVDSRILDARGRQARFYDEAHRERPANRVELRRTSLRIRLADGLRALAVRIEPTACVSAKPVLSVE